MYVSFAFAALATASLASAFPSMSTINGLDITQHEYIRPTENDILSGVAVRGPCPGFNTMANHGLLNRNGRNIDPEVVKAVFKEWFNMEPGTSEFLLKQAREGGLFNDDGTIDLHNLGKHGPIEHDVSLVRDDWNPNAGKAANSQDHQKVIQDYVELLEQTAGDETLTLQELGKFRQQRYRQSAASKEALGQQLVFGISPAGLKPALVAFLEASLVANIFGDPNKNLAMNTAAVKAFLGEEKLLPGYQPPEKEISFVRSVPLAIEIASFSKLSDAKEQIKQAFEAIAKRIFG